MLRILLILILGALAYMLFKRRRPGGVFRGPLKHTALAPTELVMDPTCKTYLPRDKAINYEGQSFCSLECRDKYKEL